MLTAKRKMVIVIASAILVIGLLYPFQVAVVPVWRLRVIDQRGEPIRGNRVRESWSHYTLETASHEEELITDSEGYVTFPQRVIRTRLLIWALQLLKRIVNVHSSYGPSASIYYMGDYKKISEDPWYEPGRQLETKIVVFRP